MFTLLFYHTDLLSVPTKYTSRDNLRSPGSSNQVGGFTAVPKMTSELLPWMPWTLDVLWEERSISVVYFPLCGYSDVPVCTCHVSLGREVPGWIQQRWISLVLDLRIGQNLLLVISAGEDSTEKVAIVIYTCI
jgi:hypothetical protein